MAEMLCSTSQHCLCAWGHKISCRTLSMSLEAAGRKAQAGMPGCQNVIGPPCATAQAKVHLSAPQCSPAQQQRQKNRRAEELPHVGGPVQPIGIFNGVVYSCCLSCFIIYVSSPLLWGEKKTKRQKSRGSLEQKCSCFSRQMLMAPVCTVLVS